MKRPRGFGSLAAIALAAFSLGAGCASGSGAGGSSRPLPSYAGRSEVLFDDGIEPAAVGIDFDKGYSPKADAVLRERAQVADGVLRVKVATVTAKKDGAEATYQLALHTVEKLGGEHPPQTDFSIVITKTSDAHGIMKNFEGRLVGTPFIAFVREFVRADGDRELHYHFAPDTKDVKAAIGDAIILGDLK